MNWLGVTYLTGGQSTGDPEWDNGIGFTSRQLRLALDLPVHTVFYAVLAGSLLAAATLWGTVGFLYALAAIGAVPQLLTGLLALRSGLVLVREAYGSVAMVIGGVALAAFGALLVAGGAYVAAFPWLDDALVERWG